MYNTCKPAACRKQMQSGGSFKNTLYVYARTVCAEAKYLFGIKMCTLPIFVI